MRICNRCTGFVAMTTARTRNGSEHSLYARSMLLISGVLKNFALRGQQVGEARRAKVAGPKVEAEIRGRAGLEEGRLTISPPARGLYGRPA